MTESINPNIASAEQLEEIPGIGPEMAHRIIANRPYETLEDLQTVRGINLNFIDKIKTFLEIETKNDSGNIEDADEEATKEPIEAAAETDLIEDIEVDEPAEQLLEMSTEELQDSEILPVDEEILSGDEPEEEIDGPPPPSETLPETEPFIKEQKFVNRSEAFLMAIGVGVVATIMALILSLGILAAINGGIRYASPAQLTQLNRQVTEMQTQVFELSQGLEGLRARVDNLETYSGRVSELDSEVSNLQIAADTINSEINTLSDQAIAIEEGFALLTTQTEELQVQASQFQTFFDGLNELLLTIFTPTEPEAPAP